VATSRDDAAGCCWPGCSTRPPFGAHQALQVVNVVYVNAMNAAQVALAAVAAWYSFGRPSPGNCWGIVLTVLGLMMMKRNP